MGLCAGVSTPRAYAGHWHSFGGRGCDLWPLFPLGIGLGIGLSYLDYRASWGYPSYYVYSSPQPVYVSAPPAVPAPAAPAPAPVPPVVERPAWVPSSPGPGVWVPDTAPDRYVGGPSTPVKETLPPPTLTVGSATKSAGGVPVYTADRLQ